MKNTPKSVFLVITSAIVVDGQIAGKDAIVEVTEAEAKNLLGRGKARLATVDDVPELADLAAGNEGGEGEEGKTEAHAATAAPATRARKQK